MTNKRSSCGVGYLGEGPYTTRVGGKKSKAYEVWSSMLKRCYLPTYRKRLPTYEACIVHPIWHNFQTFAAWYESQPKEEGWQLDKDILSTGDKIYSPDTCTLVPRALNSLITENKTTRNGLPTGVTKHKTGYRARVSINSKTIRLGTYKTPQEAFVAYKIAKESNVKLVAEENKDFIEPRVYAALLKYEVLNGS